MCFSKISNVLINTVNWNEHKNAKLRLVMKNLRYCYDIYELYATCENVYVWTIPSAKTNQDQVNVVNEHISGM